MTWENESDVMQILKMTPVTFIIIHPYVYITTIATHAMFLGMNIFIYFSHHHEIF